VDIDTAIAPAAKCNDSCSSAPARRPPCCYTAEQCQTTHERRSSPVVQQLGYLAAIFRIDDAVSVKKES